MTGVNLDRVVKKYGQTAVIHGVDLQIDDGEFCVFVGPSGCGKSTLLRMVSGLETITSGRISIDQTDVMLKSETDGEIRKAKTAGRIEGVPVENIVDDPGFEQLMVRDAEGQEYVFTAKEARGALLAQLRGRPEVVLVLPELGRAQWVTDVVEISSEE